MAFVKSGVPEWYETWKNNRTLKAGSIKLMRETKSQAEESAAAPEGRPTEIVHADKGQGEQAAEVKGENAPSAVFKVGDVVLGHSTNFKACYDMQKARIIAVLAKQYNVDMVEGLPKGRITSTPTTRSVQ